MKKKLIFGVCILCIGTVLTELIILGVLSGQGKLSDNTMNGILAVLDGEYEEPLIEDEADVQQQLSQKEISRERINRIYRLDNQRSEIKYIGNLVKKRADELLANREKIKSLRKNLQDEWEQLQKKLTLESTETARGILLKMTPEDAMVSLMPSTIEHNIVLLKGMQEKKIAEILQEFMKSPDPKIVKRGHDIFQAISLGEPEKKLVENAINGGKPKIVQSP